MTLASNKDDDLCWIAPQPVTRKFDLDDVLRSGQIEFWYQPKIDLTLKRLIGVEVFARFCTPERVISAGELIQNASSAAIVALTEKAFISALKTSANLCEIGVDVRLAVNVSMPALRKIPVVDLVRKHRPNGGKNLGLVFDIPENQVLQNFDEVVEISAELRRYGFSIAVDDFGASLLAGKDAWNSACATIAKLRGVGFSELKLDRALVRNCDNDRQRAEICGHVISLAHSFGSLAVGMGIESPGELKTLKALTCDIGQGYLFGRPMSEEDLLVLLWNRAIRRETPRKKRAGRRVAFVPAKPVTGSMRMRAHWVY